MEQQDSPVTTSSSLWSSLNSWFTSTVFFILLNLMIATIVFTSNLPNNNQQQDDEDQKQNINHNNNNQQQIARSPSILHRLKSFNFYPQKSLHESNDNDTHYQPQPLELAATQYVFNQNLDYQHFDIDSSNSSHPDHNINNLNNFNSFNNFNQLGEIIPDPETVEKTGSGSGSELNREVEENPDEFESLDEVYSRLKTGRHDRTKSDGMIRRKPAAKMKKSASLKVGFSPEEEENVEARRPATAKEKVRVCEDEDDDDVEVDSRADDFINKFKNDLKLQRIESIIRTTKGGNGGMNRGTGN